MQIVTEKSNFIHGHILLHVIIYEYIHTNYLLIQNVYIDLRDGEISVISSA
jgi:hypothetical protein